MKIVFMETATIKETISILFSMLVNPISLSLFGLVIALSGFVVSRSYKRFSRRAMLDVELVFYSWFGGLILGTVGAVSGLLIMYILEGTQSLNSDTCSPEGFCFHPFFTYVGYQLSIWSFSFPGIVVGGMLGCRHRLKIKEKFNYRERPIMSFLFFYIGSMCLHLYPAKPIALTWRR